MYDGKPHNRKWWFSRYVFINNKVLDFDLGFIEKLIIQERITFKSFDLLTFPNGMTPPIPKFEKDFKGLSIGIGKNEWGAPDYPVFIIDCGEAKNIVNV